MSDLEKNFHADMEHIYKYAKEQLKYNATRFWKMVCEKGGYQTAKQLIHTASPSDGFTVLWEKKRLDLSVEAHVLKAEYHTLFTDEEREICKKRLAEYEYSVLDG